MVKTLKFSPEDTLAQQCYENIQNEIIEGALKPGQKLKIKDLKNRFSIGQSPVREALSRLSAFGLVEVANNKGFRVARISEEDVRDTYTIFTHIENMALSLAIQNGDEKWEATIVAELYKLGLIENKESSASYTEWAARNYDFHVALIAGCNSPTLLELRRHLYMKFDRYCRMAYTITQHRLIRNHEEHKKLAEAVLEKDVKKTQELMSSHIMGSLETIIEKLKENQLI